MHYADTGGGYEVGWIMQGEWLNYMVYVNATRAYDLNLRYSGGGGSFRSGQCHLRLPSIKLCKPGLCGGPARRGDGSGLDSGTAQV